MSKLKKVTNKLARRKSDVAETSEPEKITNNNLTEHRKEVLKTGKKYKYPVSQSRRKLVKISASLLFIAIIAFTTFSALELYKFKSESRFMYQITRVFPFPIARIGKDFVSYNSYLFEIQRYTHYYSTQQDVDFDSDSAKMQLQEFRKTALKKVIDDAYVSKIAQQRGISVNDQEIQQEIEVYKKQNLLGDNDDQLKTVLRNFFGWSIDDFKTSLKQQILRSKVVSVLDQEAQDKAKEALSKVKSGSDFAEAAKEYSEDPITSETGGEFPFAIDKDNRDLSPKITGVLNDLNPGQVSDIINVGYGLEIVKRLEDENGKIKAAHILINFEQIDKYLGEAKDQTPTRQYVSF